MSMLTMLRSRALWIRLRASLWFVPTLIVLASVTGALLLIETEGWVGAELARDWPRIFGASAEGSREMLSSIATSMVTVAGVVFSITIVTLSLTSTQYSPRVLRNFMRDRPTQVVLGIFMGVFAYCLVVLRTVRGSGAGEFIPSLAVLAGMGYAFIAIGFLIFFIHHVAQSIQATSIVARIAGDTLAAIDQLFPESVGDAALPRTAQPVSMPDCDWTAVHAQRQGYVTGIDGDRLLALAVGRNRLIRLNVSTGDFVIQGGLVGEFSGAGTIDKADLNRVHSCLSLGPQRTVEQDAAFGLQQLVDVALKALSPGINDPSTACVCVDQLAALVHCLARRPMPASFRSEKGQLRLVMPVQRFEDLLMLAFRPIVHHSRGDVQVLGRVANAILSVAAATADRERLLALEALAREVQSEIVLIRPAARVSLLRARLREARRTLRSNLEQ